MSGSFDRRSVWAQWRAVIAWTAVVTLSGCESPQPTGAVTCPHVAPDRPDEPSAVLKLDASQIKPMYTELLAIDLPTAVRVAVAQNTDVLKARQQVKASQGRLESTVGGVFPALVPTTLFEHVEGAARATAGNLVGVGFDTYGVAGAIQWVINPGRVVYEIVAAKKRLAAAGQQEQAVRQETLRTAGVRYYQLVLAQARVATANEAIVESEELLRIARLRVTAGSGVRADELRAEARLAETKQALVRALQAFYESSVALGLTLQLDAKVTLVPKGDEVVPLSLVRADMPIEELLAIAIQYRPDLASVRTILDAVAADAGATWWGDFGPQLQVGYQVGGITGHSDDTQEAKGIPSNLIVNPRSQNGTFSSTPIVNGAIKELISRGAKRAEGSSDQTFGFHEQQRGYAGAGWRLSLSAFGDLKTARAIEQQARIEVDRRLADVQAQVVTAHQASRANRELIGLANAEVASAQEALRLAQANLNAGAMTTLDVLQAQDAAALARLHFAGAVVQFDEAEINLLGALGLLDESALVRSEACISPAVVANRNND